MADLRRRTKLGSKASAALVHLWSAMDSKGWSDADLARELDDHTGKIAKLLYGERRPNRTLSIKIMALVGTPIEAWDDPCPVKRRHHIEHHSTPPRAA